VTKDEAVSGVNYFLLFLQFSRLFCGVQPELGNRYRYNALATFSRQ
jgi:hypothetical protein